MLDALKDIAARQVGKVLASEATLKVLRSEQLKTAVVAAINLRAEARAAIERRVKDVATRLDLATSDEVARLRRSVRDLQDHVTELRQALDEAEGRPTVPAHEPVPVAGQPENPASQARPPRKARGRTRSAPA
jgi:hypothetical protein